MRTFQLTILYRQRYKVKEKAKGNVNIEKGMYGEKMKEKGENKQGGNVSDKIEKK